MWGGWPDDSGRVSLLGDAWLEVDAPAGEHSYSFRYLPWDVPLGIALALGGAVLCLILWRKSE